MSPDRAKEFGITADECRVVGRMEPIAALDGWNVVYGDTTVREFIGPRCLFEACQWVGRLRRLGC